MADHGQIISARSTSLARFLTAIKTALDIGCLEYGETASAIYATLGPAAAGYAIAEKGLRYGRRGNAEDLVKVAAYAFLAWEQANGGLQNECAEPRRT